MTSKLDTGVGSKWSKGDQQRSRQYLRNFIPAMVLYVVLVVVSASVGHETTTKRVAFMLVPVIPALLIVRAVVRWLRSVDEYQQLVAYRALAISFAAAMVVAVLMAFAGIAFTGLRAELGGLITFLVGMGTCAVIATKNARR